MRLCRYYNIDIRNAAQRSPPARIIVCTRTIHSSCGISGASKTERTITIIITIIAITVRYRSENRRFALNGFKWTLENARVDK